MSSTGGGIVANANAVTIVEREGKRLHIHNTRDMDVSFDETTVCALVNALGDADGNNQMII